MQDVFGAALDTTTATLQWAMAELMVNPRVMEKTQLEVRSALAGQERVQESALRDMHYLKAGESTGIGGPTVAPSGSICPKGLHR